MAEEQAAVTHDAIAGHIKVANGVEVLTQKQVCAYLEVSRGTLWNIRKRDDNFPKPVHIGASERSYWRRDELDNWLESRIRGLK